MLDKIPSVIIAIVGVSVLLFGGKADRQANAKTLTKSTPPAVMQPVATARVAEGEAATLVETTSEHSGGVAPQGKAPLPTLTYAGEQRGARPAEPANEGPPHAVSAVTTAASSPAAGGFCVNGSCGPAQASRQYTYSADGRYVLMQAADGRQYWQEVQRPQLVWRVGQRLFGRR